MRFNDALACAFLDIFPTLASKGEAIALRDTHVRVRDRGGDGSAKEMRRWKVEVTKMTLILEARKKRHDGSTGRELNKIIFMILLKTGETQRQTALTVGI
jgi:hypothetical protein